MIFLVRHAGTARKCLSFLVVICDGRVVGSPAGGGPAALITGNAQTSVQALAWLGADARTIGIVGFDDSEVGRLLLPELTVIDQDAATIASTAIALLTSRMTDPTRAARRVTVPVHMIRRGSGEVPPPARRQTSGSTA